MLELKSIPPSLNIVAGRVSCWGAWVPELKSISLSLNIEACGVEALCSAGILQRGRASFCEFVSMIYVGYSTFQSLWVAILAQAVLAQAVRFGHPSFKLFTPKRNDEYSAANVWRIGQ